MVRAAARPSPFLLAGYLAPWVEHLAAPAEPVLLAADAHGRLVGGLPLVVRRRAGVGIARWAGGVGTTSADLLLAPDAPATTAAVLGAAATAAADLAVLVGLGADPVAGRAGALALVEGTAGAVLATGPDWDAVYDAHVPAPVRTTHGEQRRALEASGSLEVVVARDAVSLFRLLPEAFAIAAGRAGGSDGSTFGTEPERALHLAAGPALADAGAALLAVVRLDGVPVAFQYALRAGASLCLLPAGQAGARCHLDPGLLAMLAVLEVASREGVMRIELTPGGDVDQLMFAHRIELRYAGIGWVAGPRGRIMAAIAATALRAGHRATGALRRTRRTEP